MSTRYAIQRLSIRLSTLLLALPLAASAQLSGTYSIAPGGDYESVGEATDALYPAGVSGPVTFEIAAGVWTEEGLVDSVPTESAGIVVRLPERIPGVSETNSVTFRGAAGTTAEEVVLERSAGSGGEAHLAFIRSSHVVLRDLALRNANVTDWEGSLSPLVVVSARDASPIVGLTIEGCILDSASWVRTGIRVGKTNEGFRFRGNLFRGFAYAIAFESGSNRSVLIEDNDLVGMRTHPHQNQVRGDAISVVWAYDFAIRANRLDYAGGSRGVKGIVVLEGSGLAIEGNRIFNVDFGGNDGFVGIETGGAAGSSIVDNMISGYAGRGISAISLVRPIPDGAEVAHNSIRISGGGLARGAAIRTSHNEPHRIRNNIIVTEGSAAAAYGLAANTAGIAQTIESNLLYGASGAIAVTSDEEIDTLEEWQAAGFGTGSVELLPEFVDPEDLHLAGCSSAGTEMIGLPLDHPLLATDFDGAPREPLIARMGAHQVNATSTDLFAPAVQIPVGTGPIIDVAAADFDGDQDLDLAVSHWSGEFGAIELFGNAGDGSFSSAGSLDGAEGFFRDPGILRAGDIDKDGEVDLAAIYGSAGTSSPDPAQLVLHFGLGDFAFEDPFWAFYDDNGDKEAFVETVDDLEIADIDDDGDLDLLVNDFGVVGGIVPSQLHAFCFDRIQDSGGFENRVFIKSSTDPFLPHSGDVVAADLDDDGDVDAVTGWAEEGPETAHENASGSCQLSRRVDTHSESVPGETSALQPASVAVPLDDDRFPDLLYDGNDDGAPDSIFFQSGNGDLSFGAPVEIPLDSSPERRPGPLVALDHDDDGDLDIFVGNRFLGGPLFDLPGSGILLVNDGDAGFTQRLACGQVGLPRAPRKLLAGDFNGDQRDDIAAVTWGTETISILLSTSAGIPTQQIADFAGIPKENTVILTWSTPSEAQNAGFGVERRTAPAGAWSSIGSVVGAGESEVEQLYQFDDLELPEAEEVAYRLRQVDFDGGVQHTDAITVVVPEPGATLCMLAAMGALSALARRRGA